MAGSSIISGSSNTTTCRVAIDVCKIRENVYATEGGKLTDRAVRNWLCSAGFEHEAERDTWLVAEENLRLLDKSEIVSVEVVRSALAETESH
jgi:hypothetical protein